MAGLVARSVQAVRERPAAQVAVVGGVLVALTAWLVVRAIDRGEWETDDWAATLMAIAVSFVFLGLAQWLQRGADRRSAEAPSMLRGHIGQMIATGALSLISPERAVEVGRHALSGAPLIDVAGAAGRAEYLDAIERVYGSMTVNVFPSNHRLPLAACRQLHADAKQLVADLHAAAGRPANRDQADRLRDVAAFVSTCLRLETWFRGPSRKDAEIVDVGTLRRLYKAELRVYCDWSDPTVPADAVKVTISKVDVLELSECYSPWYLRPQADGYDEVDYSCESRGGPLLTGDRELPTHPEPLPHSLVRELPTFRREGVEKMRALLGTLDGPRITVLVYALAGGRVILDGNHRLAAALRLAQSDEPLTAIVFELPETDGLPALHDPPALEDPPPPPDDAASPPDRRWVGFNPDAELVREALEWRRRRVAAR